MKPLFALLLVLGLCGQAFGAGAIVQENQNSSSGTGTSISTTFSMSVTAGDYIHAIGQVSGTGVTLTFSDSQGNTYTPLDTCNMPTPGNTLADAYAIASSTGTMTVTVSFSSHTYLTIWARELSGVTGVDAHTCAASSGAVTSFSVSASNANQPAIWSAVGSAQNGITAATSGTQDLKGWNFGGGTSYGVSSHQLLSSTGSQTASFSAPSGGMGGVIAIFDTGAVGGPPKQQMLFAGYARGSCLTYLAHSKNGSHKTTRMTNQVVPRIRAGVYGSMWCGISTLSFFMGSPRYLPRRLYTGPSGAARDFTYAPLWQRTVSLEAMAH